MSWIPKGRYSDWHYISVYLILSLALYMYSCS